MIDRDIIGCVV